MTDPSLRSRTSFIPSSLNRLDTARLAAYKTNLDFYDDSQWPTTSRNRQLVFNYAKVSVDKLTSFLMQGLAFACYPNPTNSMNSINSHVILSGQYRDQSHVSRTRALGRDESDNRILEEALDWDQLALAIDDLDQTYDPNLTTATRAQERADAILRQMSLRAQRGNLVVPTNCGQELLDVVQVTDLRCGIDQQKYRVLGIRTLYDRRQARYDQTLTLGAP